MGVSMARPILVTGATGNVGAPLIDDLLRRGAKVRAAVTDPARARARLGDGIEYVAFDFARAETFEPAMRGVRAMFLMRPPQISDTRRMIDPAISAAARAGVEHVVFMSLLGVERNRAVPHYAIEQSLLRAGMAWTFLRPSFFMQNLSTTHRDDIRDGSVIFVPAGRGATSFIDARDIAAVAAVTLTEDGHRNQAYPLTGSVALTYTQVAQIMSTVLGRPITYRAPGAAAFALRMRARGMAWPFIVVMLGIYTTARLGLAGTVTPDTERLLGRAPITMQQFVEDYRHSWI